MNRFCLLVIVVFVVGCNQYKGVGTEAQRIKDSNLIVSLKTRLKPLLYNAQGSEVARVLDSFQPFLKNASSSVTLNWLRLKAQRYELKNDMDSVDLYLNQALQIANSDSLSDNDKEDLELQVARRMMFARKWDSAIVHGTKADYLAQKQNQFSFGAHQLLFEAYYNIKDKANAYKYAIEGYKASANSPYNKPIFCTILAGYFDDIKKPDSAFYYFKEIDKDTVYYGEEFEAIKNENMGVLLTSLNKPHEGLPYILKALPHRRALGLLTGMNMVNLAITYVKLGDTKKSLDYLDSATVYGDTTSDKTLARWVWEVRAENYDRMKNYQAAYRAKEAAFSAYKQETDTTLAKTARELEMQYNVRGKEDRIAALALANQKQGQINQQRQIIIFGLALIILLMVAIAILLWRRRGMQMQIQEAQLRQQLLRSQMEPHFLFNTLAVLKSFIGSGEPKRAAVFLDTFSNMLRLNLENSRDSFVSLHKEIEALRSYLDLHVMSFDHLFEYHLESSMDSDEDTVLIPPMLIQPFVENAIIHGLAQYGKHGLLTIKIDKQGQYIHCIIDDNGMGLQSPAERGAKRSMSTAITKERLSLLAKQFHRPAKILIEDKQTIGMNQGVRVTLDIPFK